MRTVMNVAMPTVRSIPPWAEGDGWMRSSDSRRPPRTRITTNIVMITEKHTAMPTPNIHHQRSATALASVGPGRKAESIVQARWGEAGKPLFFGLALGVCIGLGLTIM